MAKWTTLQQKGHTMFELNIKQSQLTATIGTALQSHSVGI
jgi:hypothetical protein